MNAIPESDIRLMEDDILRSQEPAANYESVTVPGISEGRQSRVTILKFKLASGDEHIAWKRMGVGKGLTQTEAELLHGRLRRYRRDLRDVGWNVPKLFHTHTAQVGDEWQIYSYEQYVAGGDAEHIVADSSQPNYRKWRLLRSAIETLAEYPASALQRDRLCGGEVTRLPHGLDLKLANLADESSVLYFLDLFGPKELDADGNWLTYNPKLDGLPQQNLLAVCASREGAILRLTRLAEQSWTASGSTNRKRFRSEYPDVLAQSGLPRTEQELIMNEIQGGYPWLDALYAERSV